MRIYYPRITARQTCFALLNNLRAPSKLQYTEKQRSGLGKQGMKTDLSLVVLIRKIRIHHENVGGFDKLP